VPSRLSILLAAGATAALAAGVATYTAATPAATTDRAGATRTPTASGLPGVTTVRTPIRTLPSPTLAPPATPARRTSLPRPTHRPTATGAAATTTTTTTTKAPAGPAPRPVIGAVTVPPDVSCDPNACTLTGAGRLTIRAAVSHAGTVEFYLVPTGTGTSAYRILIGRDADGSDGWTVGWSYPDEPLLAHLVVVARGPGGTAEATPILMYHADPS
jgi:hypothetical protein